MKKVIYFILLLVLVTSCRKTDEISEFSDKHFSMVKKANLNYEVGGTIGCAISFIENKDNKKYDDCIGNATAGKNKLGNITVPRITQPPAKKCPECMVYSFDLVLDHHAPLYYNQQREFWEFLGIDLYKFALAYFPTGAFARSGALYDARIKIEKFNKVLYEVFADSEGTLKIPANDSLRRDAILKYNGSALNENENTEFGPYLLQVSLLDVLVYSTFVYEKDNMIPFFFEKELFRDADDQGKTSLSDYGVKTVFYPYLEGNYYDIL